MIERDKALATLVKMPTETTSPKPDTVTVDAPVYGLGGCVIGRWSVTLPRADAERILKREVK
jgi:hypothetical protein